MASTTSRRGWASGRPPAAGVLVDLLVWLPKSLPGALFAAQTARHPAVTATVQPSAKAAQPTGSETGTKPNVHGDLVTSASTSPKPRRRESSGYLGRPRASSRRRRSRPGIAHA